MEGKNICAIVIPVHKSYMDKFEVVSLKQAQKVFSHRDVFLISPQGLDTACYELEFPELKIMTFPGKYFKNVGAYNKLKLSLTFYDSFKDYDFLLTYELDSFVFFDAIDFWIEKDFDYIGAPWFEDFSKANSQSKLIAVGNSGFSLRKVETIRAKLKRYIYINPPNRKVRGIQLFMRLVFGVNYWLFQKFLKTNITLEKYCFELEDKFICFRLKKIKIASVDEAMYFSFEVNPAALFKETGQLPFGCHAWSKYDLDFWRPLIEEQGYELV